jgi:hypothetical protein
MSGLGPRGRAAAFWWDRRPSYIGPRGTGANADAHRSAAGDWVRAKGQEYDMGDEHVNVQVQVQVHVPFV